MYKSYIVKLFKNIIVFFKIFLPIMLLSLLFFSYTIYQKSSLELELIRSRTENLKGSIQILINNKFKKTVFELGYLVKEQNVLMKNIKNTKVRYEILKNTFSHFLIENTNIDLISQLFASNEEILSIHYKEGIPVFSNAQLEFDFLNKFIKNSNKELCFDKVFFYSEDLAEDSNIHFDEVKWLYFYTFTLDPVLKENITTIFRFNVDLLYEDIQAYKKLARITKDYHGRLLILNENSKIIYNDAREVYDLKEIKSKIKIIEITDTFFNDIFINEKINPFVEINLSNIVTSQNNWHFIYYIPGNKVKEIFFQKSKRLFYSFYFITFFIFVLSLIITFYKLKGHEYEQTLLEFANTDPLTKLLNRRSFLDKLKHEINRVSRTGKTISIALGDIDDFKGINTKYGHEAGDYVLKKIADIFLENFRNIDLISRWGGEEFLIALPDTYIASSYKVLEKVREIIANYSFSYHNNEINLTLSFGLSAYKQGCELNQVIKKADEMLHKSKKEGKNQINISEDK
ncbi:MAG: GGDEF domain-containing protein [Pseudomonadota bacterium]